MPVPRGFFNNLLILVSLQQPAGQLPASLIVLQHVLHACEPPRRNALEHVLDQPGDRAKADPTLPESSYRHLISCVEGARIRRTALDGFVSEAQAGEPLRVRLEKFQQAQLLPVKTMIIRC